MNSMNKLQYFMYGIKVPIGLIENEAFLENIKSLKYSISNKVYNNLNGSFVIVGKRMPCGEDMIIPELHESVIIPIECQIDTILTKFNVVKSDKYHCYYIIEESCQ